MSNDMRIALAQINTTIGDFSGNVAKIMDFAQRAEREGADIVAFPELAITGYPPRDFVEQEAFLDASEAALHDVASRSASLKVALVVGYVARTQAVNALPAQNAVAVIHQGRVVFDQRKILLPNYDVFDEARYFHPASAQQIWEFAGRRIALVICEDAWNDKQYWPRQRYSRDPVEELMALGGDLIITVNASPFNMGKRQQREKIFDATAKRFDCPVVYVNQVGGNDQLVFDGSSFAVGACGQVEASASSFSEDLVCFDACFNADANSGVHHANLPDEEEAAFEALVLGTRDYIGKCGFRRVLIGLSGGIDSALVAAVAVEAVGKENVMGVGMPGPYSSEHSLDDARSLAAALDIRFEVASINDGYRAMLGTLDPLFAGLPLDTTEENLQSRLRGVTLMALSNKFGAIVLTTGNKSELAVGYCTLYGDMCGGLAVISDVPKTLVYRLSRIANKRRARAGLPPAIPENTFIKPPSAELRPDQKDTDSLPEYEVLDSILARYVERYESPAQIAEELHFPIDLVRDIVRKVERNEYKRQQAAPGLRLTTKAFGIGRRFPIAHRFSE
jgi:NAD+ synthase (glutamine-hydrolysing)